MDLKNHTTIKAIAYAATHDEFTLGELRVAVEVGPNYDFYDAAEIWTGEIGRREHGEHPGPLHRIRYHALINYLEFVQLQDARRSSRIALQVAVIAIFIGVLGIFDVPGLLAKVWPWS